MQRMITISSSYSFCKSGNLNSARAKNRHGRTSTSWQEARSDRIGKDVQYYPQRSSLQSCATITIRISKHYMLPQREDSQVSFEELCCQETVMSLPITLLGSHETFRAHSIA